MGGEPRPLVPRTAPRLGPDGPEPDGRGRDARERDGRDPPARGDCREPSVTPSHRRAPGTGHGARTRRPAHPPQESGTSPQKEIRVGTGLTVVKCGGTAEVQAEAVCAGVARLVREGRPVVLVHGGSAMVTELAGRLGVPLGELVAPDGTVSRRTDPATLEVVTLALAGKAKPALLLELARRDVPAVGLTGLDAGLLRARRKKALRTVVDGRTVVVRDDRSGRLTSVATPLLHSLLADGMVPVLSPPALAEDGRPVNVNADRVAAAVAAALG
ncbi:hypothetical protein G3I40_06945, partial [Streptomyces sp. SID14478]|nr:hypothetical protein [Streptomyces sp. SID14478]